jgi:hypothetical protein
MNDYDYDYENVGDYDDWMDDYYGDDDDDA